uniref:Uncharacterized protein n=1 Tax=Glossina brevipalpis TaxID=37001 RepID=A0A1A9WJY2_9MUSC
MIRTHARPLTCLTKFCISKSALLSSTLQAPSAAIVSSKVRRGEIATFDGHVAEHAFLIGLFQRVLVLDFTCRTKDETALETKPVSSFTDFVALIYNLASLPLLTVGIFMGSPNLKTLGGVGPISPALLILLLLLLHA